MTSHVRLRIALADRPGALARVATVIADHGGNITAVDVQQGSDTAVDDVVVSFASDADFAKLRSDLSATGGGTLLSHQAAQTVDPVVAALRAAAAMVADRGSAGANGTGEDPDGQLLAAVAELCAAPVVWVGGPQESAGMEAGQFARDGGGSVALRTSHLPPHLADRVPGEAWLLAVPDLEHPDEGRVVFVARASSEFTTTEIGRVEALLSFNALLTTADA